MNLYETDKKYSNKITDEEKERFYTMYTKNLGILEKQHQKRYLMILSLHEIVLQIFHMDKGKP